MARLAATILRLRWLVIAIVAALTALAASFLPPRFDNSLEVWFLRDDPELIRYQKFIDRFEADDLAVVGLFGDRIFHRDGLETIDRLTTALGKIDQIVRVRSLTTMQVATSTNGGISIEPAIDIDGLDTETPAERRTRILSNRLLTDSIVSKDGRATVVAMFVHPDNAKDDFARRRLGEAIMRVAQEIGAPTFEVAVTGGPPMDRMFNEYAERDMTVFGLLTVLIVLASVWVSFRRLSASLIPMLVVIIAGIWTYGLLSAVGWTMNIVSTGLIGLLLAVGVADSIHILSDYYQHLMAGESPDDAVRSSLQHLIVPCLFTSMTTAAGMLSLSVSQIRPVQEFGIMAAAGVTFAFLLSVTLVPCVLRIAKAPDPEFIERQRTGFISRVVQRLARPTRRSSIPIVGGFAILIAMSLWASANLVVANSNPLNYFVEDEPIRVDTERIDEALGGTATVEFVIHAPDGGLLEPAILARIKAFQQVLKAEPGISSTFSIVDVFEDLNQTMIGGDETHRRIPDSRARVAQLSLLLEGEEDLEQIIQDEYSIGRISAGIRLSDASTLVKRVPELKRVVAESFAGPELSMEITGFALLISRVEGYLVESQIDSLAIAMVVITLMMMMLLRSVKLGLFSMIPNCGPIVLALGFMAAVGIPLDPSTVMIGSIALGLVVDDTVHFLARLRPLAASGMPMEEAIAGAMHATARPLIVTSIVLVAGFSAMILASFTPNIYFGVVASVVIILALIADLIALPAMLVLIRPKI